MAKFTDAIRDTIIGYFNAGDQPTEAQFTDLITRIQEGIEEKLLDGSGDGDSSVSQTGILMADDAWIGIGAALERIVFDAAGGISIMGAKLGINELAPGYDFTVRATTDGQGIAMRESDDVADDLLFLLDQVASDDVRLRLLSNNVATVQLHSAGVSFVMGAFGVGVSPTYKFDILTDAGGSFAGQFFNDGDDVNRHVLKLRGGADNGAAVGSTYYIRAADGDDDVTGDIKTVDGVFQLADVSDERRKTKVRDTELVGLEIINGLCVRDYNWKGNPDGPMMTSFVAQEAQKVYPAMISEIDEEGTLGTSRAMLIPILTKAIQELDARLTNGGL